MSKSSWKTTKIFKELLVRKGDQSSMVVTFLERSDILDTIETILDKGGSTPKNFTLHDADHSYRVAERMWDLIPDVTRAVLSDYEFGFLLLSAYLHDIGMSPDFERVEAHKDYLTSKVKTGLTEYEIDEFQKWIDNDDRTKSIDIRAETVDDHKVSDYILSYYIRTKHNDWSGEWIKNNFEGISLANYYAWTDDLILVCKSHHYGIDNLINDSFDPKPVGPNAVVHLRYLAMCLRVADVMENDPERTPEVILKHRLVSSDSLVYWLKDRRFDLIRDGNRFTVYARPERAYLHKAIEETAEWIEDELKLCNDLIRIKPLKLTSFRKLKHYEWCIDASLHKDIKPKTGTYEYIQGAFRPNTAKILELLGGNQLYGSSKWAYRELIQNAFDAVKEKIAYRIINGNKNPKEFLNKLGELYTIEIVLEKRSDGIWLVCKDQGAGMTQEIIEKYFLESGSSKRHEISDLERKSKEHGFNFSRTGQFGIGILSYFMIADKIVVKTKRELNTGYNDSESIAWRFEINGTHDFGELSRYKQSMSGTEVELKLKIDIERDITIWDEYFSSFLKETIAKSPCNIKYVSKLKKEEQSVNFGWTNDVKDIKTKIVSMFKSVAFNETDFDDDLMPESSRRLKLENNTNTEEAIIDMEKRLEFLDEEGELDGVGRYRIFIPYFKLNKGKSFCYIREKIDANSHHIMQINDGHFWYPSFNEIFFSLKGIGIKAKGNDTLDRLTDRFFASPPVSNVYIEIDFEIFNEKLLSVSRHSLKLEDDFLSCKNELDEKVREILFNNKGDFDNVYGLLNHEFTNHEPANYYWAFQNSNNSMLWKRITYPICSALLFMEYGNYYYDNKPLKRIWDLRDYGKKHTKMISWMENVVGHFKMGMDPFYPGETNVIPILTEKPAGLFNKNLRNLNAIELPKEWSEILLFDIDGYSANGMYLNSNYKDFELYNLLLFDREMSDLYEEVVADWNKIEQSGIFDETCSFNFLIYMLINCRENKWIGLCENKADLVKYMFGKLEKKEVFISIVGSLIKVTPKNWIEIKSQKVKDKIMPWPKTGIHILTTSKKS